MLRKHTLNAETGALDYNINFVGRKFYKLTC
jgi:hypothetical protein